MQITKLLLRPLEGMQGLWKPPCELQLENTGASQQRQGRELDKGFRGLNLARLGQGWSIAQLH